MKRPALISSNRPRNSLTRLARACALLALTVPASCMDRDVVAPAGLVASRNSAALHSAEPAGFALAFNGATSSAATPNGAVATTQIDDIRIEAWVKWNGPGAADGMIFYNGHSGVTGWGFFVENGTGRVGILAGGVFADFSTLALAVGQWQHVTAERIASVITVNVDGATFSFGGVGVNGIGGFGERTLVGRGTGAGDLDDTPNGVFNGLIDDVQISTSSGTLIERWTFDEGSADVTTGDNGTALFLRNLELVFQGQQIAVDINPRNDRRVRPEMPGGKIDVAVYSSAGFDASTIDPATVQFGPAHASPRNKAEHVDVNHDGRKDLVFSFEVAATGITCMHTTAWLLASTRSAELVAGVDGVRTLATELPATTKIVRCDAPRILATDITPDAEFGNALDVNDLGQVVGNYILPEQDQSAFRWSNGVLTLLPSSGFSNARAISEAGHTIGSMRPSGATVTTQFIWQGDVVTDIVSEATTLTTTAVNSQGEVAGTGFVVGSVPLQRFAFHWQNGATTRFADQPGMRTPSAVAINESGQIAGGFLGATNSIRDVYLWDHGVFTVLSTPPDPAPASDFARGLNDLGQVVGQSFDAAVQRSFATVWTTSGATRIGTEPGNGVAINNLGQVLNNASGFPSIWTGSTSRTLETLGMFASASRMNELGQAIGLLDFTFPVFWDGTGKAFRLTGGQYTPSFATTVAMNNKGQVVGRYRRPDFTEHAVLWTITWAVDEED
ncbi:MAG: LamG-like jellyroll fold domain-containing protein [Gemmatimonadaceae bacterium]